MDIRTGIALLLLSLPLSLPAAARDCTPAVKEGWIRLVPGGMPMHAGFGRIANGCPTPATIVSASSPAYGSVDLHESKVVGGINRMRPLPELRIDANAAATMQPGGIHLMLMRPSAPLKPGDRVAITFKLKDGRSVPAQFEVRMPAL